MVRILLLAAGMCLVFASVAIADVYDCNVSEARAGAGRWVYPPHTYADSLKKLYENATTECPNYARLDELDLWEWAPSFDPPKSWIYMLFKFEYPTALPAPLSIISLVGPPGKGNTTWFPFIATSALQMAVIGYMLPRTKVTRLHGHSTGHSTSRTRGSMRTRQYGSCSKPKRTKT